MPPLPVSRAEGPWAAHWSNGFHVPLVSTLRSRVEDTNGSPESLHELGRARLRRREIDVAADLLQRAADAAASNPEYFICAGNALRRAHRSSEAEQSFEHAFAAEPQNHTAALALATSYVAGGRPFTAVMSLLRPVIEADPERLPAALVFCRSWLHDEFRSKPTIAAVTRWLPHHTPAGLLYCALGTALMEDGRYDDARSICFEALARDGSSSELVVLLARLDRALAGLPASEVRCRTGLRHHPRSRELVWQYVDHLLSMGEVERFRHWIRGAHARDVRRTQLLDLSVGRQIRGKTVLLPFDEGYDDMLQSCRFASQLRQHAGCRVVIEAPAPIVGVLSTLTGVDAVVAPHDPLPPIDAVIMPRVVPLLLDPVSWSASRAPYLGEPALPPPWVDRVRAHRGLRVGLCWESDGEDSRNDPFSHRSLRADVLEPLLRIQGVMFLALSHASNLDDPRVKCLLPRRGDFRDIAAAIAAVDLVVTVDATVVHLAGASGKPALLMLPYAASVRWGERRTTAWYASVETFRQPAPGAWAAVVDCVAREVVRVRNRHVANQPRPPEDC